MYRHFNFSIHMFVFYSQILFLLLFPVLKPLKDHNLALVTPFHLLFCQPSLLFTTYLPTYLLSPQTNLIPTPLTRKTKNKEHLLSHFPVNLDSPKYPSLGWLLTVQSVS